MIAEELTVKKISSKSKVKGKSKPEKKLPDGIDLENITNEKRKMI